MENKTDRLNNLFKRWMQAHSEESEESLQKTISGENITKDFFEIDGIIDEKEFEKAEPKVLFISAEANVNDYTSNTNNGLSDYRQCYKNYHNTGKDDWGGKMRERISGMYKYLTHQNDKEFKELANKFAVMDINKRGGKANIDKGKHLIAYTELYRPFINEEISIIDPDIVVLVGINLCRLRIVQRLGCIEDKENNRCYFNINGRNVPILLSFQTANVHFQAKRYPPLPECDNAAIGILCAKLKEEIDKYGINN